MIHLSKDINIFTITTILVQSLLIVILNQIIFVSDDLITLKKLAPLVNLIVLILTILVLHSIKEIEGNAKKTIEMELLKTHLKQIEDLITTLQIQKHEYARHVQTIQAMLYMDELDSVRNYIDGISKNYRHTEDMVHVENPALAVLLNSKKKVAESYDISFDFAIKCNITKLNIPSWDLCSIIGNLLDNAFEAANQNKDVKKGNVGLEIKLEGKKYKIYVYNNGSRILSREQDLIFKEGYTTKDSKARGYGLYIVKTLVDQYEGEIKIKSGKKTTFTVSFPIEEGVMKNSQTSFRKTS